MFRILPFTLLTLIALSVAPSAAAVYLAIRLTTRR